ncbi:MAG TPA: MHYT domain-containing protein [Bryobacteraceae bacterium]|jgi:PAS domain S-box-containing protein|nr:MHYT domain-containing protein [Bryobacteraceae bacterium]
MKTGALLTGTYDFGLVSVSIAIAICASYAALRLGARVTAAKGTARLAWLTGGAVAMGFGIWSMHYVGMLAFSMPMPVLYDLSTVIISLLAAILASGVALFVVSRETITGLDAALGGVFMGSGIVAMHYIGMAAMRLQAVCRYNAALVGLSAIIAVACSLAALWATFRLRGPKSLNLWKILSAVAMGIGIAAMHYTGMAAATFYASPAPVNYANAVSVSALGTAGIVMVAFLVLGFAVFTSIVDQRLAAHRDLAEELYRSRQMLQSILDNIPQRVFWKDPTGRYLGCNRAFAQDAGLSSPDEVSGKTDPDLPWSELGGLGSVNLGTTMKEKVINSEIETSTAAGERRWLRASSIPLHESSGRSFAVLGAYDDITDQKAAEEAIKRSNVALSEFAHIVAHDLQSPLRVARNYIQLLARRYGQEIDENARNFMRSIEESVDYMDGLIYSLLSYATATEPAPEGQSSVSLNAAFQQAVANLQLLISETQAQITLDPLPAVNAYPIQMVQLFENLLSNAIKYRKPHSAPSVHISAKAGKDEWIFSFRDNGIGIAPEYQEHIFAPLKRLHGRETPGFGIGLATCRKLVEHLGGRIWVESKFGVGSTFCFTLPKVQRSKREQGVNLAETRI